MPYIGAKHVVFAPIADPEATGIPTYLPGLVVGRIIEMNEAIEYNDAPLYSDGGQSENDKSFKKGKFTANLDDISRAVKKLWFGMKELLEGGVTVLKDAVNYDSPYGGYGFYRIRKKAGVRTIEGHWYYKTKWTRPNNEAKTKGESVEWQTPKCEGEIMAIEDDVASWHIEAEFATEAEAIAWLDGLAGITTPDVLALSNSVPADGAVAASKANALVLTFNNVMSQSRCKFCLIRNDTGAEVPITGVTWDANGKVATLAHGALTGTTLHTLVIMAVDVNSQALDTTVDFTTAA